MKKSQQRERSAVGGGRHRVEGKQLERRRKRMARGSKARGRGAPGEWRSDLSCGLVQRVPRGKPCVSEWTYLPEGEEGKEGEEGGEWVSKCSEQRKENSGRRRPRRRVLSGNRVSCRGNTGRSLFAEIGCSTGFNGCTS